MKIKTPLVCPECGGEEVSVFGREITPLLNHTPSDQKVTWVKCDNCSYERRKQGFFRIRRTRIGVMPVRPEARCINAGRLYMGEIRRKEGDEFLFVGLWGSEVLEVWLPKEKIALAA